MGEEVLPVNSPVSKLTQNNDKTSIMKNDERRSKPHPNSSYFDQDIAVR